VGKIDKESICRKRQREEEKRKKGASALKESGRSIGNKRRSPYKIAFLSIREKEGIVVANTANTLGRGFKRVTCFCWLS